MTVKFHIGYSLFIDSKIVQQYQYNHFLTSIDTEVFTPVPAAIDTTIQRPYFLHLIINVSQKNIFQLPPESSISTPSSLNKIYYKNSPQQIL
jgi:hypothetical protein